MIVRERRPGLRDVVGHIVAGASKTLQQSAEGDLLHDGDDPLEQDLIAYMRTAPEAERRSLMQIIKLCIADREIRERALKAISSGAATASAILALIAATGQ